jgi:PAS domain S-box-containing protein
MLASSQDCVTVLGNDGAVRFLNDHGRDLLEIEPDDVRLVRHWSDLWPEDPHGEAERSLTAARGGGVGRFTGFSPTAKGTPKWWDVVVSPIRDADGQITDFLAVLRDISAHKSVELALSTSEERFRGLADNMAQLAWMADGTGNVFWYNRRWLEFAGLQAEEMSGHGWRKVHHPDYIDRVVARVTAAFKRREAWQDVVPLRRADGEYRWFLTRAMPVTDPSGRVALWCATHTDITEQRRLSQRLRQLARVIELSHEAILIRDLEDGIVMWNRGCEELYQYRKFEALGARSHDLLATQHPMGVEAFEQTLRADGEWSGELRHRAKDGTQVWVDSRQEIIRSDNRLLVLQTDRDITGRRKADELRDLLVAELDHRVKNSLAVVQSIARETARYQPDITSFLPRFSDRVQALAAAQTILSDAHWSGASLRQLVWSQITLMAGATDRVTMTGEDVVLPPEIALQLTLVVHELTSNALRHGALSRSSGVVIITWQRDEINSTHILIDWRESGGPRIFAPGTSGFGQRVIERAGRLPALCTVLEYPPDGAHCRIGIELPEARAGAATSYFDPRGGVEAGRSTVAPPRPPRMAGRRLLLIEDDPIEALRMEEILSDAGYLVVGTARTSEAAARLLQDAVFDAVLIASESAVIDNRPIVEQLEAMQKPVLALAGWSPASEADDGDAISKPVSAEELLDAIARLGLRN